MDITLGELNKLPIKKLKELLKRLAKEEKNVQINSTIEIIKNLIRDKKRRGTIRHEYQTINGKLMKTNWKPIHLRSL